MKQVRGRLVSPKDEPGSKIRDKATRLAASSAVAIVALHSKAFAAAGGTAQPVEVIVAPILGPAAVAALGVTLVTIGAYRQRKARKRSDTDGAEKPRP